MEGSIEFWLKKDCISAALAVKTYLAWMQTIQSRKLKIYCRKQTCISLARPFYSKDPLEENRLFRRDWDWLEG